MDPVKSQPIVVDRLCALCSVNLLGMLSSRRCYTLVSGRESGSGLWLILLENVGAYHTRRSSPEVDASVMQH